MRHVHSSGASDLVLRNVNTSLFSVHTGEFEVYDVSNNRITAAVSLGQVGLEWQLGGFAADPPTGSMGSSGSISQLVQAMAGFGGSSGAAISNTAPLGADTSQQTFLTTPHACGVRFRRQRVGALSVDPARMNIPRDVSAAERRRTERFMSDDWGSPQDHPLRYPKGNRSGW
jgi:hypothetical protein